MKCATHPAVDSVAFCGQCGRALCAECKREVRGMIYCENCLATRLQPPLLPPLVGAPGGPNPGLALFLGFIPGVGAIYNGQVVKAMVQVLIFGSLIALSNRITGPFDTIFGLGAAAFYAYMVVDSYQTARRKLMGLPTEEWLGLGEFKMNAPVGAALLIGLGALFLLDNLGVHVFNQIAKFWPVVLIVIGLILLQKRMGGSPPSSGPGGSGSGRAAAPKGGGSGTIGGPRGF
jgi:TM2 domain-containing membrane protein YozV